MGDGTRKLATDRSLYTAVIGDMLASKALSSAERAKTQQEFATFINALNDNPHYQHALVSKFVITLGDEFQGILKDASVVPDLIWDVAHAIGLPAFRLGIGYGTIDTAIPAYAINLDGPALHAARRAINEARTGELLGGVFCGFGENADDVANGLARLLQSRRDDLTTKQDRVLGMLRPRLSGVKVSEVYVAAQLGSSTQVINKQKHAAGVDSFLAGEQALRGILRIATKQLPL
jgi:SatD family (SatD)